MIVIAEGAAAEGENANIAFSVENSPQAERYGGAAWNLCRWLEKETQWESRHVVLGHLQRSRHPTPTDRFLTLAMGVESARMVCEQAWGQCTVYRGGLIQRAPISDLMGPARLVPENHRWIRIMKTLGTFL